MERHRLERAAAEKARVEAAAVTAKLEATALADAARREKDRTVEVATVRSLRQNLELQSRPWRDARARRTKGVDWTPTHKPIFISYAPTQDATYDELAFCQKMVETLNEIRTPPIGGESTGERVACAWLDANELGTLVTSTDERALARLEACESCAGVICVVSAAYLDSEQCALERDVVRCRRTPVKGGGDAHEVPVVVVVIQGGAEGGAEGAHLKGVLVPEGLLGVGDADPIEIPLVDAHDPIVAATTAVRALESLRERSGQLRECLGGAAHPGFEPATRTLNTATLTAGRAPDERDVKAWMDANDGSWYVKFIFDLARRGN